MLAGYLALLCTLVGYTFWFFALRRMPVANVAISIFAQPVVGILVAWWWVAEVPTAWQIAGTAAICLALAVTLVRPWITGAGEARVPEDIPPSP